jgi:1-acyl-sn-glycerol-3-phosphate acyltransferase
VASEHVVPEVCEATVARSLAVLGPLVRAYFRSEVRGLERVPPGQCLLVTHHDGGVFPINAICLGVGWYEHFGTGRPLYVLSHDIIHAAFDPFTDLLPRSGLVRADRAMMEAVAKTGHSMLVLPGAARESFRPYRERARIDLGGRIGFVRQAMRLGIPIVPVVSAGSHETLFVLRRGGRIASAMGLPRLVRSADVWPLIAGFPWGIWAAPFVPHLPLPAKITTEALAPIVVEGDPDREADVRAGFDRVLGVMRGALQRLYAARRFPVVG